MPSFCFESYLRADLEASLSAAISHRRDQADFVVRGLQSLADSRQNNDYVDADVVIAQLQRRLDAQRARAKLGETRIQVKPSSE